MDGTRLDRPHDSRCVVFQGADPDDPRCFCGETDGTPARPARRDRPATPRQTQRMQRLFRAAGITDRAERLARTAEVVGRQVSSGSHLTERENRAVCEWLQRSDTTAPRPTPGR